MEHRVNGFIKLDLHVHSTSSVCYLEDLASADDIVEAALRVGLGGIAITDHNTAGGIDYVRLAGRERGLVVFPGIEVSTASGHVLALFDPEEDVARLHDLLSYLEVPADLIGDGMGNSPLNIEEAFAAIESFGGIAVAAHVERWGNGFVDAVENAEVRRRIYESPHLSALEITQPGMKQQWNEGRIWGLPLGRACIQGSDAHSPMQIGRRAVYLRMNGGRLDLSTLKDAFAAYPTEIRFPHELATP